jgi:hypothetical protein
MRSTRPSASRIKWRRSRCAIAEGPWSCRCRRSRQQQDAGGSCSSSSTSWRRRRRTLSNLLASALRALRLRRVVLGNALPLLEGLATVIAPILVRRHASPPQSSADRSSNVSVGCQVAGGCPSFCSPAPLPISISELQARWEAISCSDMSHSFRTTADECLRLSCRRSAGRGRSP